MIDDKDEARMDIIGQNGNDGAHYDVAEVGSDYTRKLHVKTDGKEHQVLNLHVVWNKDNPQALMDYKFRHIGQTYVESGVRYNRLTDVHGNHTAWCQSGVFVKKPSAVLAVQYDGNNAEALAKQLSIVTWGLNANGLWVHDNGLTFYVGEGWWVFRGAEGWLCTMTNEAFTAEYEVGLA